MELKKGELVNRYDDPLLSEYYSEIVACLPEYPELRNIIVMVLKEIHRPGETILDIGAGRGDSTKPILEDIEDISVDLLDVSAELLGEADEFLSQYKGRYKIILEDALMYLNRCVSYRTMISEFTVHNFYQEDKDKLFEAVYRKLEPGGSFVLLDKIQQDDPAVVRELFEAQVERYKKDLDPRVLDAMIFHETDDLKEEVRMRETETLERLKKVGFAEATVVKRIKRDVAIRAIK
jgi:ubiquinone/menaquinone biosynthesis C-methylase UbiE